MDNQSLSYGLLIFILLFSLAFTVVIVASQWKVYEKAGKPGWGVLVPIYNTILLLEIVGKPLWWIALLLIPGVNIIAAIIIYMELAERFGKSSGFAIGMILLPFIFLPILGFGDAEFEGGITSAV